MAVSSPGHKTSSGSSNQSPGPICHRVYDCEAYRLVQTNMGHSDSVRSVIHIPERNQRDPDDKDVPYCTLKSFPANIEHCIQWARDKFESSFSQKPNLTNEFCSKHQNLADIIQRLRKGMSVDGAVQAFKVLYSRPVSWADCVHIGRLKFQKYFHNRAKQLLHAFPADTILPDGTLFWQSPKRPPTPVEFDPSNDIHMTFVISTARLYAGTAGVSYGSPDLSNEVVMPILSTVKVPEFRPSSKAIITDVAMTKADTSSSSAGGDELLDSATKLESLMNAKPPRLNQVKMCPASFEKDDDTNGHIDFFTAAANLRAAMYNIEPADWFKAKKIAGRIIPAIATTTASVAGLVTIELMKVMKGCPLEDLKNCFFSLALPCMVLTEPSRAMKVTVREGMTYSLWDRWDVKGSPEFTLQQFLHHFKEKYGFAATSVVMGVKMIYIPMMPNHGKRLPQTMVKLLKPSTGQQYADLMVMFEGDGEEDVGGPSVGRRCDTSCDETLSTLYLYGGMKCHSEDV